MNDPDGVDAGVLARRLDAILTRRRISASQAAREITAAGTKVTHSYISALRNGDRKRPSYEILRAIADYLRVDISYFTDPDPGYQRSEVDEVFAIADSERIRAIAHHATGLSAESYDLIIKLIDKARAAEGLPPVVEDLPPHPHQAEK